MIKPIVLIIGTRPEGIKMMPLYFALKKANLPVVICSTTQHNELLTEVFDLFGIKPDFELDIMRPGQDLFHITNLVLEGTKKVFSSIVPALVVVQGDTTSTMAASLAAFYLRIPVAHVEAGLRTASIDCPFPEELNRRIVTLITQMHFAPTKQAKHNLVAENIDPARIFNTGNTVVDALRIMKNKINHDETIISEDIRNLIKRCKQMNQKLVLLTAHRRESFAGGIKNILTAVKKCMEERSDLCFFYPYHPNPQVIEAIKEMQLINSDLLVLSKPISYKNLVYILLHCDFVATDSGGICEEAVSLQKQVLILRNETERMEGIEAGFAHLVGTETSNIVKHMIKIANETKKESYANQTIFGDGYAAEKIVSIIQSWLSQQINIQKQNNDHVTMHE
jgi:UDP-N-acetylglucosamine 2-epimerase (non-hydrolysing)